MIEIYTGNGKGKTTAAVGLALRAAGRGVPVIFTQFLKDGSSGEVSMLRSLEQVAVVRPRVFHGFVFRMTPEQKAETAADCERMLRETAARAKAYAEAEAEAPTAMPGADISMLIVLDEILDAVRLQMVREENLLAFLDLMDLLSEKIEIVLTGRDPTEVVLDRADLITETVNRRHPYDRGVPARVGVEL